MENEKLPVLGIILGDHAGIGPEICLKAVGETEGYIPLLIGNKEALEKTLSLLPFGGGINITNWSEAEAKPFYPGNIYLNEVASGGNIEFGRITRDSGLLCHDGIIRGLELEGRGIAEALVMAPITKQSLHAAGLEYSSENDVFADYYKKSHVPAVIKCEDIYRSTVVGHYPFREIVGRLTTEKILDSAHRLLEVMARFVSKEQNKIAVSALNPHAGENGLFGDEESRIIEPAIQRLIEEGVGVIGPCPADTVFLKAVNGEVGGIVFLYHDQGNIAMKSRYFGEGVLIYSGISANIVSVGHGSALDIAGKGVADEKNTIVAIKTALSLIARGKLI